MSSKSSLNEFSGNSLLHNDILNKLHISVFIFFSLSYAIIIVTLIFFRKFHRVRSSFFMVSLSQL